MNTILLALFCGALVGFCLGALGGGGGILVWPALVFGIGTSGEEASLLAKIIVGTCAMFAGGMHWRKGTIDFRTGLTMSALGMVGAAIGARFIRFSGMDPAIAERAMYAVLALLMLVVAALMLRKGLRGRKAEHSPTMPPTEAVKQAVAEVPRWILFILASLGIGFITGFLGVGGGFMIVPVLVLVFQLPMKVAAGTSLVVISLNCAVGIAASTSSQVRWDVAILFAVSSIVASAIAVRVADGLKQSTLQIAFSGLIIMLGAMMVWKLSVA